MEFALGFSAAVVRAWKNEYSLDVKNLMCLFHTHLHVKQFMSNGRGKLLLVQDCMTLSTDRQSNCDNWFNNLYCLFNK